MPLHLENLSVLCADDAAFARSLLHGYLDALGVGNIYQARNGQEAIDLIKTHSPHMTLLDWEMQPVNGLEVLRFIRHDASSPNRAMPVIMVSAYTRVRYIIEARNGGVSSYLAKPIVPRSLYMRMKSIIDYDQKYIRTASYFGVDRRKKQQEQNETQEQQLFGTPQKHAPLDYEEVLETHVEPALLGKVVSGGGPPTKAQLLKAQNANNTASVSYVKRLSHDLHRLRSIIEALPNLTGQPPELLQTLHNLCHDIRGTAGSFGYESITQLADNLCNMAEDKHLLPANCNQLIMFHYRAMIVRLQGKDELEKNPATLEVIESLKELTSLHSLTG
ncbi:MAG: response regulator [Pseudomonadota bacterium]